MGANDGTNQGVSTKHHIPKPGASGTLLLSVVRTALGTLGLALTQVYKKEHRLSERTAQDLSS